MKKVEKKYSNKGITLVTLVVTIIVLIILAGVSINLILGKNGIITIAKQAKENTELAKIEEETKLNELYMQIEAEGIGSGGISYDAIAKLVEFKREIASAISDMGVTTSENADASTMATNIRSISGASSADKVSYDNTNSGLTATNVQGAVDELNSSLKDVPLIITNKTKWAKIFETSSTTEVELDFNLNNYNEVLLVGLRSDTFVLCSTISTVDLYNICPEGIVVTYDSKTAGVFKKISDIKASLKVNGTSTYVNKCVVYAR